jgi:hypothetical protein
MTKQLLFATMWGVLDLAGGRYPLHKLPEVRTRFQLRVHAAG